MPKKIKVKLTKKVSSFWIDGEKHVPGEVFEIPEDRFSAHFMKKVAPPKKEQPKPAAPLKEKQPEKEKKGATSSGGDES